MIFLTRHGNDSPLPRVNSLRHPATCSRDPGEMPPPSIPRTTPREGVILRPIFSQLNGSDAWERSWGEGVQVGVKLLQAPLKLLLTRPQ
jgi:hypothetical protein